MAAMVQSEVNSQMASFEDEKFYKDLDPILDEINKKIIKMDEDLKKKYTQVTLDVVNYVIARLKETNEIFNKLYSKLDYVGSYFDGLRVGKATEFDLNLIMKMPCDYKKIQIENTNVAAGFVKVKIDDAINNNYQPEIVVRTIKKWCNGGYLLENRVREWMESIITSCLGHGTTIVPVSSGETVRVNYRKCGPAFTLTIKTEKDVIDVDLVFTIQFPETVSPPSPIRWTDGLAASWVLVPKPSEDCHFWRVSFSNSERKLIGNQYKLKLINRFLKALRDAQPNIQIPSYFIKTLFLWEAHECNMYNRPGFWEKRQGYLFIYMLKKQQLALSSERLSYYWHKKMNLFQKLSTHHMKNMANQINHIISKINLMITKKDNELRSYILNLFKISDELPIADLSIHDTQQPSELQTGCSIN